MSDVRKLSQSEVGLNRGYSSPVVPSTVPAKAFCDEFDPWVHRERGQVGIWFPFPAASLERVNAEPGEIDEWKSDNRKMKLSKMKLFMSDMLTGS